MWADLLIMIRGYESLNFGGAFYDFPHIFRALHSDTIRRMRTRFRSARMVLQDLLITMLSCEVLGLRTPPPHDENV